MKENKNAWSIWFKENKFFLIVVVVLTMAGFWMQQNSDWFQANIMTGMKQSSPFDGTALPVKEIPNYNLITKEQRKGNIADIDSKLLVALPDYYDSLNEKSIFDLENSVEDKKLLNAKIAFTAGYTASYSNLWHEGVGDHAGIDIILPTGTPIYAIANAVVLTAKSGQYGEGNYVVLRHDDVPSLKDKNQQVNYWSAYLHLDSWAVEV